MSYREELIRKVEQDLNALRREEHEIEQRIEAMVGRERAKLAEIEHKIIEARAMLQFVKTGKEPDNRKRKLTAHEDYVAAVMQLGKGGQLFTAHEVAELVGATYSASRQKLKGMDEVEMVQIGVPATAPDGPKPAVFKLAS